MIKPFRWLSVGVVCGILIGCATTVQPTATPEPTVVPTAINNPQEAWQQWPTVLTDTFRDNRHKWSAGVFQYDEVTGQIDIGPELYRMEIKLKEPVLKSSLIEDQLFDREKGFYISVEAKSLIKLMNTYGILFLSQKKDNKTSINSDTNAYYFEITGNYYRLLYSDNNEWQEIIATTNLPKDSQQEVNDLAVVVEGNTITLLFNDTYLTDIEVDDPLKSGTIGVMCGAYQLNVTQICEFDNLEVRMPE